MLGKVTHFLSKIERRRMQTLIAKRTMTNRRRNFRFQTREVKHTSSFQRRCRDIFQSASERHEAKSGNSKISRMRVWHAVQDQGKGKWRWRWEAQSRTDHVWDLKPDFVEQLLCLREPETRLRVLLWHLFVDKLSWLLVDTELSGLLVPYFVPYSTTSFELLFLVEIDWRRKMKAYDA